MFNLAIKYAMCADRTESRRLFALNSSKYKIFLLIEITTFIHKTIDTQKYSFLTTKLTQGDINETSKSDQGSSILKWFPAPPSGLLTRHLFYTLFMKFSIFNCKEYRGILFNIETPWNRRFYHECNQFTKRVVYGKNLPECCSRHHHEDYRWIV